VTQLGSSPWPADSSMAALALAGEATTNTCSNRQPGRAHASVGTRPVRELMKDASPLLM
jgi:hypothetical protein